jgi:integrase
MAYIRERKRKDGTPVYKVEIRLAGQKPCNKTFDNIFDAEHFARALQTALSDTVQIPRSFDDEERRHQFFEEPVIDAIQRFERSEDVLDRHTHILPSVKRHVGKVKFGQIKKSWVKSFVQKLRSTNSRRGIPYSDQTIACMVQTLNVVAKWRADDMDLPDPRLPLTVERMKGVWKVERNRRLAAEEEHRLMQRLRQIDRPNRYHWRLLVRLALETGARQMEMVKAEWSEVNIEKRLWLIPAAHTKTKETRAVPLTRRAARIFKLLKLLDDGNARVFNGLGASQSCVATCFARYVKGAAIDDFHFHDLRHEAISRMVLYWREFKLFELMTIVGHSSIKMFKRYANLRGDELVANFRD